MKKIAVHSLLLLIILGSGRLQAVAGPAVIALTVWRGGVGCKQ